LLGIGAEAVFSGRSKYCHPGSSVRSNRANFDMTASIVMLMIYFFNCTRHFNRLCHIFNNLWFIFCN